MTVFISRCWLNVCRAILILVLVCTRLGMPAHAQTSAPSGPPAIAQATTAGPAQPVPSANAGSSSIDLINAALTLAPDRGAWVITADFKLSLSPAVEEAVNRGLPLYFVSEFELIRPRWYWRDERAVTAQINYKLWFNSLTRQYRLSANSYQTTYERLEDALGVISRLRGWRVAEADRIKKNDSYEAWLRLRLDTSQLPKPFQVGAIANRDWNPESEWKKFPFPSETAKSAP
jgi:hypothetical protein